MLLIDCPVGLNPLLFSGADARTGPGKVEPVALSMRKLDVSARPGYCCCIIHHHLRSPSPLLNPSTPPTFTFAFAYIA